MRMHACSAELRCEKGLALAGTHHKHDSQEKPIEGIPHALSFSLSIAFAEAMKTKAQPSKTDREFSSPIRQYILNASGALKGEPVFKPDVRGLDVITSKYSQFVVEQNGLNCLSVASAEVQSKPEKIKPEDLKQEMKSILSTSCSHNDQIST